MRSWVIPSNPTAYLFRRSMAKNGHVDWVTRNKFEVGDTVYVYEVIGSPNGGGIIYKTEVIMTGLSLGDKFGDIEFWSGQIYPQYITEQTKFSRLKFISEPNCEGLSFEALKEHNFTAPQSKAHILDKKPDLLSYIQNHFSV